MTIIVKFCTDQRLFIDGQCWIHTYLDSSWGKFLKTFCKPPKRYQEPVYNHFCMRLNSRMRIVLSWLANSSSLEICALAFSEVMFYGLIDIAFTNCPKTDLKQRCPQCVWNPFCLHALFTHAQYCSTLDS